MERRNDVMSLKHPVLSDYKEVTTGPESVPRAKRNKELKVWRCDSLSFNGTIVIMDESPSYMVKSRGS